MNSESMPFAIGFLSTQDVVLMFLIGVGTAAVFGWLIYRYFRSEDDSAPPDGDER